MAVVTLRIRGKEYSLACDDGEEDQLLFLASEVEERTLALAHRMGNAEDATLLLLTALTLADELQDLKSNILDLRRELRQPPAPSGDRDKLLDMQRAITLTLEEIAGRIERIADRVEG